MKWIFMRPVPKAIGMLQCTITRDKSGFNRLFPKYILSLSEGGRFLLNAKKRTARTSNYMITFDQKMNRKGGAYLGKVRSNFLGTEFNIYDWGENPKKKNCATDHWRTQQACVLYESNVLGSKGPRKMRCIIPEVRDGQ